MKKVMVISGVVVAVVILVALYAATQFGSQPNVIASGKVAISTELESDAVGMRTVFITIFDTESPAPMPYGATKELIDIDAKGDFVDFVLTPERIQLMNPNAPQPKTIRVKARLDLDGAAGMDQPGDLFGSVENIPYGSENITVTINQKVN